MTRQFFRTLALTSVCASMILAQGIIWAQGPGGTPPTAAEMVTRQVERLTDTLTLTGAQQSQATGIFTASQASLSTLQTSMQTARKAIQAAIPKNDTATITAQAQQIGALTAQVTVAQANAEAQFYQVLTADQQTKYLAALANGGGRGGFGGPRPGRARQNQ